MRGPARLLALLAVAAATGVAAAADRFVPTDSGFVVANVRQAQPDEQLLELLLAWRANPTTTESVALATAYIERARSLREPAFFGRAEAVLAPLALKADAMARCVASTPKYCSIGTTSRARKICSMRCCVRLLTISRRVCCVPRCAWYVANLPVPVRIARNLP